LDTDSFIPSVGAIFIDVRGRRKRRCRGAPSGHRNDSINPRIEIPLRLQFTGSIAEAKENPMRTAIIILCGFLLLAACVAAAKLVPGSTGSSLTTATIVFIVIWFFAAAANLWVGVSKAGYTVAEELPIFLLIFLLPAVVAAVIRWKWL